jgi:hypothetical protein
VRDARDELAVRERIGRGQVDAVGELAELSEDEARRALDVGLVARQHEGRDEQRGERRDGEQAEREDTAGTAHSSSPARPPPGRTVLSSTIGTAGKQCQRADAPKRAFARLNT